MDLFNTNSIQNIVPFDGEVLDYGFLFNSKECQFYLTQFLNADFWTHDELLMFGKQIKTSRKVAWFGNLDYKYSYSSSVKKAIPWTPELISIKKLVESKTGEVFNSCLLNLYHNGNEGMGWHQDNEKELGKNPVIASLSFGAARKFSFKHIQTKQKVDIVLEPGSLLLMKGETQENWLHSLPKTSKVKFPRVNLTFRNIYT
ncbi:alkylated DNA repair dioxygenase AlkB [Lutibacter oceani]|uniref:Alkylated DNA repair dioxygenase AlkB n=1 Tax=Lutibacter oceani TaxID=1853311 RepID=A0A3D9RLW0_9FLAO|nr:alpha-ketoglutarate-dependent dioxygenase AlkB [Lutibacter oceani]REE80889.1 alkylated DNA repair dioxygenase AlkB [Lutibacter oceani]